MTPGLSMDRVSAASENLDGSRVTARSFEWPGRLNDGTDFSTTRSGRSSASMAFSYLTMNVANLLKRRPRAAHDQVHQAPHWYQVKHTGVHGGTSPPSSSAADLPPNATKNGLGAPLAVAQGGWKSSAHERYDRFSMDRVVRIPAVIAGVDEGDDPAPLNEAGERPAGPPRRRLRRADVAPRRASLQDRRRRRPDTGARRVPVRRRGAGRSLLLGGGRRPLRASEQGCLLPSRLRFARLGRLVLPAFGLA